MMKFELLVFTGVDQYMSNISRVFHTYAVCFMYLCKIDQDIEVFLDLLISEVENSDVKKSNVAFKCFQDVFKTWFKLFAFWLEGQREKHLIVNSAIELSDMKKALCICCTFPKRKVSHWGWQLLAVRTFLIYNIQKPLIFLIEYLTSEKTHVSL